MQLDTSHTQVLRSTVQGHSMLLTELTLSLPFLEVYYVKK